MDVPRQKPKPKRARLIAAGIAALVVVAVGLSHLPSASPSTERSTLLIDRVVRGDMLREVRGTGTLVPEDLRVISALTAGRIDRILVRPGTKVDVSTVVLGGLYAELAQWLVPAVEAEIGARVLAQAWAPVTIRVCSLGGDAGILGAAGSVVRSVVQHPAELLRS